MAKCPRCEPLWGKEGEWHGAAPIFPVPSSHGCTLSSPQAQADGPVRSDEAVWPLGFGAFSLW